jgi:hypothetical protein
MWIGRNAFVQGICANIGEGETFFLKTSRARGTHAHVHYICAQDRLIHLRISLSQSRDSCSRTKFSREFPHISCSCQKVVRLFRKSYHFSAYQLFPPPYQLFLSQGTPIPRTGTASFYVCAHGDTCTRGQSSCAHILVP